MVRGGSLFTSYKTLLLIKAWKRYSNALQSIQQFCSTTRIIQPQVSNIPKNTTEISNQRPELRWRISWMLYAMQHRAASLTTREHQYESTSFWVRPVKDARTHHPSCAMRAGCPLQAPSLRRRPTRPCWVVRINDDLFAPRSPTRHRYAELRCVGADPDHRGGLPAGSVPEQAEDGR